MAIKMFNQEVIVLAERPWLYEAYVKLIYHKLQGPDAFIAQEGSQETGSR